MKTQEVLDLLENENDVAEFYVLVREIKVYLDVGHDQYHPRLGVKIYKTILHGSELYHFDTSHHAHGPEQIGPYYPSRTTEETERAAIDRAISSVASYIQSAIAAGHEPSDKWLVPNDDF